MLRFSIPLVLLAVFPNGVQEAEQRKTRRVLAQNYRPRRPVEDYSQSQSPHQQRLLRARGETSKLISALGLN